MKDLIPTSYNKTTTALDHNASALPNSSSMLDDPELEAFLKKRNVTTEDWLNDKIRPVILLSLRFNLEAVKLLSKKDLFYKTALESYENFIFIMEQGKAILPTLTVTQIAILFDTHSQAMYAKAQEIEADHPISAMNVIIDKLLKKTAYEPFDKFYALKEVNLILRNNKELTECYKNRNFNIKEESTLQELELAFAELCVNNNTPQIKK